jgi:hypothetical protein
MRQRANLTEWMDEPSSYEDLRDCLRDIERWAAGKRIAVKLTGVDLNPDAIRVTREKEL